MRAVAPAIIVTIASLCGAPELQAQEPPPAPAAGEPAAQPPIVSPGKAKGAWTGEYPIPKPPLPEGPAPSACPAAAVDAEGAGAPGAAACPGAEHSAPH